MGQIFSAPFSIRILDKGLLSMDLYQRSIDIILSNQHKSGAYIASPNFPTYAYSWFRDGSFIAYAMDRVGHSESSQRFHQWSGIVIERQARKINELIIRKKAGEKIKPQEYLPARFNLDGTTIGDDWTDFQLDGYGSWLWALSEHHRLHKDDHFLKTITPAVESIINYLISFWDTPSYDCWEEHLDAIHPYTLAAIYGGLKSAYKYLLPHTWLPVENTIVKIRTFIRKNCVHPDGYYRKLIYPDLIEGDIVLTNMTDASLIGLAVPYEFDPVDNGIIRRTLQEIESKLYYPNGGVYRNLNDTYYGGGEWILLAAWLGWYWCRNGQYEKAAQIKSFIIEQADERGNLPEQISDRLLAPSYYTEWVHKWGDVANPLLWSHAMYIILCSELKDYEETH